MNDSDTTPDKAALLEEEAFAVRHVGGEIPEVAMHGAIYFLTEDPAGPRLHLHDDDLEMLKSAVVDRYRTILLRDLEPANRDENHFRGMARCVANWRRLYDFCSREEQDMSGLKREIGSALLRFLFREQADVVGKLKSSCLNCTPEELRGLADDLGLEEESLPTGWQELCSQ